MNKGSLKYQLISLQLTVTMIILAISWTFMTVNDYFFYKENMIKHFEKTSSVVARNLSTCIDFDDKDECQRVLRTMSDERVISAEIFNIRRERLSTFSTNVQDYPAYQTDWPIDKPSFHIGKGLIYSNTPILEKSRILGRLYIVYKFDVLGTFLTRYTNFFVIIMAGSILIGVFLSMHFQRKITSQINFILKTINRIREQEDFKLRTINEMSSATLEIDEFKQLALSFDNMIEQIELRDNHLKMKNEDLEKLVEEKLQELYKQKETAIHNAELASLGEMAGGIAHEINNPLAIIKGTTVGLKRMLAKDKIDKESFLECVNDIDVTVNRISGIVTGLRNISRRSDDGQIVECNFKDIFDDVFAIAGIRSNSKGVQIIKKFSDADTGRRVLLNRIQLSQVLVNLLNNSFDAVQELEEQWVEVHLSFAEKDIVLKITDSGNGIPAHIRDKMFNPFYTTKEVGKGTGIGLSISKSIIEKFGGAFYYDESARNTCFIMEIPQK